MAFTSQIMLVQHALQDVVNAQMQKRALNVHQISS